MSKSKIVETIDEFIKIYVTFKTVEVCGGVGNPLIEGVEFIKVGNSNQWRSVYYSTIRDVCKSCGILVENCKSLNKVHLIDHCDVPRFIPTEAVHDMLAEYFKKGFRIKGIKLAEYALLLSFNNDWISMDLSNNTKENPIFKYLKTGESPLEMIKRVGGSLESGTV